jgi:hypothetical protein
MSKLRNKSRGFAQEEYRLMSEEKVLAIQSIAKKIKEQPAPQS